MDLNLTILIILGSCQIFLIFYIILGIRNDVYKCNSRLHDLRVESQYEEINKLKIKNETLNKIINDKKDWIENKEINIKKIWKYKIWI